MSSPANERHADFPEFGYAERLPAAASVPTWRPWGLSHDLLRHEQVVELVRSLRAGEAAARALEAGSGDAGLRELVERGTRAKQRIVASNLRLTVAIARRYARTSELELADLIQEGAVGLIRAAEKFDHRMGVQFSTYAVWWIRHMIVRAVRNLGRTIRLPSHVHDHVTKVYRARRTLFRELGRDPRLEEIAACVGFPAERVRFLLDASRRVDSLDRCISSTQGEETKLADLLAASESETPEEDATRGELTTALRRALAALPERERTILELRFGLGDGCERSLVEIAERFGLTKERIRQLAARALARLGQADALRPFSGSGAPTPTPR